MADSYFVPYNYSQVASNLDKNLESYVGAMGNQFDQETQTGRRDFTRTAEDAATQAKQFAEDYARYTSKDQIDRNKSLAGLSRDIAMKLSNAANAYGQRGLLNS